MLHEEINGAASTLVYVVSIIRASLLLSCSERFSVDSLHMLHQVCPERKAGTASPFFGYKEAELVAVAEANTVQFTLEQSLAQVKQAEALFQAGALAQMKLEPPREAS